MKLIGNRIKQQQEQQLELNNRKIVTGNQTTGKEINEKKKITQGL